MHNPYVTVGLLMASLSVPLAQTKAQNDPAPTNQSASIEGIVFDEATRQPIVGATIVVKDPTGKIMTEQRVGADGAFRLAVKKKQTYVLNTKATGYDPVSEELTFSEERADRLMGKPIALHRTSTAPAVVASPPSPVPMGDAVASTASAPAPITQTASVATTPPTTTAAPSPVPTAVASTPAPTPVAKTPAPAVTPPATSGQPAAVATATAGSVASATPAARNRRGAAAGRPANGAAPATTGTTMGRRTPAPQPTAASAGQPAAGNAVPAKTLDAKVSFTPPLLIAPKGMPTQLKSIRFAQSKPELLPESQPALDQVVDFMASHPVAEIDLAGHTDNQGDFEENLRLSKLRVEAVKEYLVSKGIDGKRVTTHGYGPTRPIASNNHEETRQLNRRVELTVVKE